MKTRKTKPRKNTSKGGFPSKVILGAGLFIVAITVWAIWTAQSTGFQDIQRSTKTGTEIGEIAPNFQIRTLEGSGYELLERGEKPTIVFFMAYWCGTCIPEAIALNEVRENYGQKVEIVVIDLDPSSTPTLLGEFKELSGNGDFIWGFDINQAVTTAYKVRALDTTLVIDQDGYVVFKDEWPTNYGTFADALSRLGL